jgi:hypothetical protein
LIRLAVDTVRRLSHPGVMNKETVTLVAASPSWAGIEWTTDHDRLRRVFNFDSIITAVQRRSYEGCPIERVVLEGTIDSLDFLMFLSTLPSDFKSDILLIDRAKHAYLSSFDVNSMSRVLYDLDENDIRFYVDVNELRDSVLDSADLIRTRLRSERLMRPRQIRALVADDERHTREFLLAALADLGCDVVTARTGVEAARRAAEKRPQVVFEFLVKPVTAAQIAGAMAVAA